VRVSAQQVSDDELFAEWDDRLPEPSSSSDQLVRLRLQLLAGPSAAEVVQQSLRV
jgi:hypothetical protein